MALNFPSSPTVGQVYSGYTWDGEKWTAPTNIGLAEPPNDDLVYGRRQSSGVGAWQRSVALAGDTMTGQLTVNYGAAAQQSIAGNSTLTDTLVANFGYASVRGNANAGAYSGTTGFRAKLRASVAGVGTLQHTGDLTYGIAGVYGWVPTGGHGPSAMAGLLDRPDGLGHAAGHSYSVVMGGGLNNNLAKALAVYDWIDLAYTFIVDGDGTVYGKTQPANDNSTKFATTAYVDTSAARVSGSQTLTGGFRFTPYNGGTLTAGQTFTPNAYNGNYQYYINSGAHTFAAPANDCAIDVLVTNSGTAGAITFSGFTVGLNVGDALTAAATNKFLISIRRINATSTYIIKALQ